MQRMDYIRIRKLFDPFVAALFGRCSKASLDSSGQDLVEALGKVRKEMEKEAAEANHRWNLKVPNVTGVKGPFYQI